MTEHTTPRPRPPRQAAPWDRPSPRQPGTLGEQLSILELYLCDPTRKYDPAGAWQLARKLVLPHARRGNQ